jgi:hypothetical protein
MQVFVQDHRKPFIEKCSIDIIYQLKRGTYFGSRDTYYGLLRRFARDERKRIEGCEPGKLWCGWVKEVGPQTHERNFSLRRRLGAPDTRFAWRGGDPRAAAHSKSDFDLLGQKAAERAKKILRRAA